MIRTITFLLTMTFAVPGFAQELEDYAEKVSSIKGGAIYDEKVGVDGSWISDRHFLTHMVCSKGSTKLRMMLPFGLDDDGTFFTMDGAQSTLVKTRAGYQLTFKAGKKSVIKNVELKPTNDKAAYNKTQFVLVLDKGDVLWTAMRDGKAMAMIGTGGEAVTLPSGKNFRKFLSLCGL
jgi:hypothetical protein